MQQKYSGFSVGPFYVGDIPFHWALFEVRCDSCFHAAYLSGDGPRKQFREDMLIAHIPFVCSRCQGKRITRTLYAQLRAIPIEDAHPLHRQKRGL